MTEKSGWIPTPMPLENSKSTFQIRLHGGLYHGTVLTGDADLVRIAMVAVPPNELELEDRWNGTLTLDSLSNFMATFPGKAKQTCRRRRTLPRSERP